MMIMVTMMMMDRFTTNLRYLELPCDLITREVLQELAGRWEEIYLTCRYMLKC